MVTIRVISGQQLPKPEGGSETGEIIDPYVRIEFTGVNADRGEYKTKVVKDNGEWYNGNPKIYYLHVYGSMHASVTLAAIEDFASTF